MIHKHAPESFEEVHRRYHHFAVVVVRALVVMTVVMVVSLAAQAVLLGRSADTARQARTTAQQTKELAAQQRAGRRAALATVCAGLSAVVNAGRTQILAGGRDLQPPVFERNLQRLGRPPARVRRVGALAGARAYAQSIAEEVNRTAVQLGLIHPSRPGGAAGRTAQLVNPDGSLNCRRLIAATVK